jgi:phosphate-transporting ATPase
MVGEHFRDWTAASPLLAQLGLPDAAKEWPVARCSTGERLRLALVRALMAEPLVLLLDEPTAALDGATVASVEAVVRERLGRGMSALWVTHDAEQAKRVARRLLTVESGVVRETGIA